MTAKRDTGRTVTAVTLIGLGILFLLAQAFNFSFFGAFWPLLVVLPGLPFLFAALTGDRSTAGLVVPGAMISGTGAILFYQNLTGHWESWAYIWSLYIVLLGASLIFVGSRTENNQIAAAGRGFLRWGLIGFVCLWALFELVIFGGNTLLGQFLLPAVLIGAGAWFLIRRPSDSHTKSKMFDGVEHKGKAKRLSASEELQMRIDAALAEPDDPHTLRSHDTTPTSAG